MPDLTGKIAVVIGASDGIGRGIAARLARAGAEVIMPVRDTAKGAAAADSILSAIPRARIGTRELDLSSLASVVALMARAAVPFARAGWLVQPVERGLLPALLAATDPDARGGVLYGPSGFLQLSGAPVEQAVYRPGRSRADAARIWTIAESLTGATFPA